MKRLAVIVCLLLTTSVFAQEDAPSSSITPGIISLELAPGYFLNPTAALLDEGNSTIQYCSFVGAGEDSYSFGQGAIAVYGLSESIEIGGQVLIASPDPDNSDTGYGPQFRIRLVEEDDAIPQVAAGAVLFFGDIEKDTVYAAATKTLFAAEDGIFRSVVVNAGAKHFWVDAGPEDIDDTVGFAGLELGLPRNVYLIAETSTKPEGATKEPYAFGLQVRHPDGFGFTLSYAQPGDVTESSLFIGVGINFL